MLNTTCTIVCSLSLPWKESIVTFRLSIHMCVLPRCRSRYSLILWEAPHLPQKVKIHNKQLNWHFTPVIFRTVVSWSASHFCLICLPTVFQNKSYSGKNCGKNFSSASQLCLRLIWVTSRLIDIVLKMLWLHFVITNSQKVWCKLCCSLQRNWHVIQRQ